MKTFIDRTFVEGLVKGKECDLCNKPILAEDFTEFESFALFLTTGLCVSCQNECFSANDDLDGLDIDPLKTAEAIGEKLGKSIETKAESCPACGIILDRAIAISPDEPLPKEGDYTVCAHCATALVFNKDLSLHSCTDEEFTDSPPALRDAVDFCLLNLLFDKAAPGNC